MMAANWTAVRRRLAVRRAAHRPPWSGRRVGHGSIVAPLGATLVPLGLVGFAMWSAWGGALHWQDLLVLAICYSLTGLGITVGFHRLLTHRSFKTSAPMRALFAVLGSAAIEGPVIEWVANHRKHHRFSDQPGDPHSPNRRRPPS